VVVYGGCSSSLSSVGELLPVLLLWLWCHFGGSYSFGALPIAGHQPLSISAFPTNVIFLTEGVDIMTMVGIPSQA